MEKPQGYESSRYVRLNATCFIRGAKVMEKIFVKVKGQALKDGVVISEAETVVPYRRGGSVQLPDVTPFNTNVWLSGDDGYNMRWLSFTEDGLVQYFYSDYYAFEYGRIHVEKEIRGQKMVFDFTLVELEKNPDYAIALKVRKALPEEDVDECSKFFGNPCLPEFLCDKYPDDSVFFAQIRCEDLKDLDPDCRLPHEGYLYFFLDAEMYPSEQLYMMVDYCPEEPEYVLDDYNLDGNIKGLNDSYVITFEKVDADYEGTKLLGRPSNDVDDEGNKGGLLLQYDPLDFDVPFLSSCDGYAFVFFGKTYEKQFSDADYMVHRS